MPGQRHGDGVAGDAGLRAGEQAVLSGEPVDQRGLAGIGPSDHGDADRPLRRRRSGGRFLVRGGGLLVRQGGLGGKGLAQGVVEVAEPFAVLGGHGNRRAKAEVIAFERAGGGGPALALVGDDNGRLGGAAQQGDEGAVRRHHAGAGVDDEEHGIGRRDRRLGLGAHPPGQAFVWCFFEAGGVDAVRLEHLDVRFVEVRPDDPHEARVGEQRRGERRVRGRPTEHVRERTRGHLEVIERDRIDRWGVG